MNLLYRLAGTGVVEGKETFFLDATAVFNGALELRRIRAAGVRVAIARAIYRKIAVKLNPRRRRG